MINFNYNHIRLDVLQLQEAGIASTREIEEFLEGDSIWDREIVDRMEIYVAIGFTNTSKAIGVGFTVKDDADIVTEAVLIPTV